jgi:heat shock protein HtpX
LVVTTLHIAPRRSMMFFALLALTACVASYLVIFLIAAGCMSLIFVLKSDSTNDVQIILLGLFGFFVGAALVWSIFPRRDKFTAPGVPLSPESQPLLFAELKDVAIKLGETLPTDVYLIPDMNAYVADRGGWMGFQSHRIMAVGLPLLSVLTVSEFRAVLAHEFAHYYGGDTSLGPWVFKTRMAMIRAFENMNTISGLARLHYLRMLYIAVAAILKWNFQLFMLITNLVARRQEYRADELACLVAGKESMKSGLEKIHCAGAAWKLYWDSEVFPIVQEGKSPYIAEGYAHFISVPQIAAQLRGILKLCLEKETQSRHSTHPPLKKRLLAISTVESSTQNLDSNKAVTLVGRIEETEVAFVRTQLPRLPNSALTHVPWVKIASDVTLPMWTRLVSENEKLLMGLTVADLPKAIGQLEAFAKGVINPRGLLLDYKQRKEYAAFLLAVALSLLLIDQGWELRKFPASLRLKRGDKTANAFEFIDKLRAGVPANFDWISEWGLQDLANMPLSAAGRPSTSPVANQPI